MNNEFSKWVACWGTATSISDRSETTYSKDLTLRYPVKICFSGSRLRFHFSNLTGTEDVTMNCVYAAKKGCDSYSPVPVTFCGQSKGVISAGEEIVSDEIEFDVSAGETVEVSMYFEGFTQMNAGTQILSPLCSGKYSYGNFAAEKDLPLNLTRNTKWFYFLNTIDIYTESKNKALICYGDSITCTSWTDYLSQLLEENGINDIAVIRRAVCGTRILRQYECITYAAYGLKGETRFPIETEVAGADAVIIHHGINDIIHPVGKEINVFRPMSDMPSVEELINGTKNLYINHARKKGLKVYGATLLPIYGWRTYSEEKEKVRTQFNDWIRTSDDFDLCIDFDKAVRNPERKEAFGEGMDSGDHLHPAEKACMAMAQEAYNVILNQKTRHPE